MVETRDMLIELADKYQVGDNSALASIVAALPQAAVLKPWQVAAALGISDDIIYRWIKTSRFDYVDLTSKGKARYGIVRDSLIKFLRSRVNHVV